MSHTQDVQWKWYAQLARFKPHAANHAATASKGHWEKGRGGVINDETTHIHTHMHMFSQPVSMSKLIADSV